jgi:hypothetical protein
MTVLAAPVGARVARGRPECTAGVLPTATRAAPCLLHVVQDSAKVCHQNTSYGPKNDRLKNMSGPSFHRGGVNGA